MKKFLATTAALMTLFIGCNRDEEKNNSTSTQESQNTSVPVTYTANGQNPEVGMRLITQREYEATEQSGTIVKGNMSCDTSCFDIYLDNEGKYTEKYIYGLDNKSNNKVYEKWTYTYDNNGNKTEEKALHPNGDPILKSTYQYDSNGKLTGNQRQSYNVLISENERSQRSTYQYDDKDNLIEQVDYSTSTGALLRRWTYKYDDKGNKIEINSYESNGNLYEKITYEYDNNRNLIKEETSGPDFITITYQYNEYDQKGNWTKRTKLEHGKPTHIVEREILYY